MELEPFRTRESGRELARRFDAERIAPLRAEIKRLAGEVAKLAKGQDSDVYVNLGRETDDGSLAPSGAFANGPYPGPWVE